MVNKTPLSFPNLNYKEMRKACSMKRSQLAIKYGLKQYETPLGKYWYKDNGATILAVAHLDSVMPFTHFARARMRHDTKIYCPTLDDRLGAYTILDWLPKAGVKCDILLTENEETANSTSIYFEPPTGKKYNWMFMFDRRGTDVSLYDYYNYMTKELMSEYDFKAVRGSYSCIADLEHLGCKGFNFGIGYYDNHDKEAYARKSVILSQLKKFMRFYKENHHIPYEHYPATQYISTQEHSFTTIDTEIKRKIEEVDSEKSDKEKIERFGDVVAEFKRKKEAEKAANAKRKSQPISETAKASLLMQDPGFLHNMPFPLFAKLIDNDFHTIAMICRTLPSEFRDKGFTTSEIVKIQEILTNIENADLKLGMDVTKYGIIVKDIETGELANYNSQLPNSQGQNAAIADEGVILKKKKGLTEEKGQPLRNKAVVIQPKPGTRAKALKVGKSLVENGYFVNVQDQCVRCHKDFETKLDGKNSDILCPECKAEFKSDKVENNSLEEETSKEKWRGLKSAEEMVDHMKAKSDTYPILDSGTSLIRRPNDKTKFVINEGEPRWETPRERKVGFTVDLVEAA